jgi:hypothetical protein
VRIAQMTTFPLFINNLQIQRTLQAWPTARYMADWLGYERCNLYIRLEHWRPDMSPLIQHLGFVPEMGHLNRSLRHHDYRTYYDDETAELVGNLCARDIQQFGYRF